MSIETLRKDYLAAVERQLIEYERFCRGDPDRVDVEREAAMAALHAYHDEIRRVRVAERARA